MCHFIIIYIIIIIIVVVIIVIIIMNYYYYYYYYYYYLLLKCLALHTKVFKKWNIFTISGIKSLQEHKLIDIQIQSKLLKLKHK